MLAATVHRLAWKIAGTALCLLSLLGGMAAGSRAATSVPPTPLPTLPPVAAAGVRLDTLFLGGYARGSFSDAMQTLASDLSVAERTLVGQHLDKIFAGVVGSAGLGEAGRLRVAYERAVRPDGTTRSIRVLVAEAAVGGALHAAYYYERDGSPGYYDPFGRSLDAGSWQGPLQELRVTSPFGLRRLHPILGRVLPHTGVDYAAARGTAVRATGDGIVTVAGIRGGYGNLVEIQHPSGYTTRYAHLSRIAPGIAKERMVRQGEVIGYVGMSGLATGPHLHYEVRQRGRPVDPARVTAATGITGGLSNEADWPTHRRSLAHLLARTPRLLDSRGSGMLSAN